MGRTLRKPAPVAGFLFPQVVVEQEDTDKRTG